MGGGSCDDVSVWGVETSSSVSMQGIKVGEASERSSVSREETPSVWMWLGYDVMARARVPAQWIIMAWTKLSVPVNLGIIWSWTSKSITSESRHKSTIPETTCIFVNWWMIFMIIWTKVQKRACCRWQKLFSPGGTFSVIFTIWNVLAWFWINRKPNFDMNGTLWVWKIITHEKRQEMLIDPNF